LAYGWTPQIQDHFEPVADGMVAARLIRVDRGGYLIATSQGVERCYPSPRERATGPPVTGDWITARRQPGYGLVVEAIAPRTTEIVRTDPAGTGVQVLVANVDTMFILQGLDRPLKVGRVERLCLITWDAGATPVVILTKTDLDGTAAAVVDLLDAIDQINRVVPGADVVPISSTTGAGVHLLAPHLQAGVTVGLLAESGAGKSTLINRLAGEEVQATGSTRSGDSKGKHTTTSRDLVPLPSGAVIIDTPGLRAVSLTGDRTGLGHAYSDVESLFERCQFRDCSHRAEPGCAVIEALASGELTAPRWAGYQKLSKEMAFERLRADHRARRAVDREMGRRYRKFKDNTEKW
jgi:ribosome biogenesis GTPase